MRQFDVLTGVLIMIAWRKAEALLHKYTRIGRNPLQNKTGATITGKRERS